MPKKSPHLPSFIPAADTPLLPCDGEGHARLVAKATATPHSTLRRVLEYLPQSTLPHSARPPALEQAKRFRFGDARCLRPAAASLLIARLFQPSMRRKRNRAGLFFRKARLRGSFFTNFARRFPPACTFWEYEPH